jgi:hypothetical protein
MSETASDTTPANVVQADFTNETAQAPQQPGAPANPTGENLEANSSNSETPTLATGESEEVTQHIVTPPDRIILRSHLLQRVGAFLGQAVDKAEHELSDEYKILRELFFQSVLLHNAINSCEELAHKVTKAVSDELHRVSEEQGVPRPAWVDEQAKGAQSPIITA